MARSGGTPLTASGPVEMMCCRILTHHLASHIILTLVHQSQFHTKWASRSGTGEKVLSIWLENIFSSLPTKSQGGLVFPLLELFPKEGQKFFFVLFCQCKEAVHGRHPKKVVVPTVLGCLTKEHQRYLTSLTCRLVFTLH